MEFVTDMLRTAPHAPIVSRDALADCIRACSECEQTCIACADACLEAEHAEELRRCIRLNLACADVCETAEHILSRHHDADLDLIRQQVQLLALACRKCGDECLRHSAAHEHCRVCMEACRACEQACYVLIKALSGVNPHPGLTHH